MQLRLVEARRRIPLNAVYESLERPDTDPVVAEAGRDTGVGEPAPFVERGARENTHGELATPLEFRVDRQLKGRRDVMDRRHAELGEVLLRGPSLTQPLSKVLGATAARTRASAVSATRPVVRPFTHSSPGTWRVQERPARSSATPFAIYALRSQRFSNIGVVPLTESMMLRSGEKRACRLVCVAPVLLPDQSSYAPQSPPVSQAPGLMRAAAAFTREANGAAVLTSSRLAPMRRAPAWLKCVWSSMKPGVTNRPPASITRVRAPRCASASAFDPTAMRRSPRIATACALGCNVSPVQMRAFRTMTSASCAWTP